MESNGKCLKWLLKSWCFLFQISAHLKVTFQIFNCKVIRLVFWGGNRKQSSLSFVNNVWPNILLQKTTFKTTRSHILILDFLRWQLGQNITNNLKGLQTSNFFLMHSYKISFIANVKLKLPWQHNKKNGSQGCWDEAYCTCKNSELPMPLEEIFWP